MHVDSVDYSWSWISGNSRRKSLMLTPKFKRQMLPFRWSLLVSFSHLFSASIKSISLGYNSPEIPPSMVDHKVHLASEKYLKKLEKTGRWLHRFRNYYTQGRHTFRGNFSSSIGREKVFSFIYSWSKWSWSGVKYRFLTLSIHFNMFNGQHGRIMVKVMAKVRLIYCLLAIKPPPPPPAQPFGCRMTASVFQASSESEIDRDKVLRIFLVTLLTLVTLYKIWFQNEQCPQCVELSTHGHIAFTCLIGRGNNAIEMTPLKQWAYFTIILTYIEPQSPPGEDCTS